MTVFNAVGVDVVAGYGEGIILIVQDGVIDCCCFRDGELTGRVVALSPPKLAMAWSLAGVLAN